MLYLNFYKLFVITNSLWFLLHCTQNDLQLLLNLLFCIIAYSLINHVYYLFKLVFENAYGGPSNLFYNQKHFTGKEIPHHPVITALLANI